MMQSGMVAHVSTKLRSLSESLEPVTTNIKSSASPSAVSSGVCVHRRHGVDWHRRCDQWERVSGSNRHRRSQEPVVEPVRRRISHLPYAWILYVGDHEDHTDLEALGSDDDDGDDDDDDGSR